MHTKPVVLIFPFDLLSHHLRCMQLAEELREQYEIYFADSSHYRALLAQAGYKTFPCAHIAADEVLACARRFDFSWLNDANLRRTLQSQIASIQHFKPSAVLGDTVPSLKMAAEATHTPFISLMNGYMTKYYRFVRSIAQAHPAARYAEKLPVRLFEKMIQWGEHMAFRQVHRPFQRLRREWGLRKLALYLDELEGDYNLICDAPSLFPQKKLPRNYAILGPLFHHSAAAEPEIHKFLDNGRRSILVSLGSSGAEEPLAFLNEESFAQFNIVVAGEARGVLQGRHIFRKAFVNNCAIMPQIDLLISHGGNGTIYQALAHGVPVLCATSMFEQEWNVQRLAQMQLGEGLGQVANAAAARAKIEHWMAQRGSAALRQMQKEVNLAESKRRFREFWHERFAEK